MSRYKTARLYVFCLVALSMLASCSSKPQWGSGRPITAKNASQVELLHTLGRGYPYEFSVSPDGKLIALLSYNGIWVYRIKDEKVLHQFEDCVESQIAWSPDGSMLAVGGKGGRAWVWDTHTWEMLAKREGGSSCRKKSIILTSVSWTHDGRKLTIGTIDNTIWTWYVDYGVWRDECCVGTDVSALAWTLEGDLISLGGRFEYVKSENTSVYKWGARNFISRKLISNVNHSEGWAYWSPNGHYVFTGGFGQPLRLWDIFSGEIVMEQICCSQGNGWSKDSSRLAYMDWQNKISVWDVNKGELIEIGEQGSRVNDVAWTPEGDILALGEKEANYSIWNVESGDQILDLSEHISRRMPINIPGVGLRAISIMADDSIIIWDGYTGERLASFNQPSGIRVVKWSPDGTKLATGDGEGVVRVWDAEKGKMLVENKIDAYSEMIDEMNWSPHGDKLSVQGRLIDTVHVLDASTGKILFVFTDDLPVEIASWSPKGDMLAVGSYLSSGGESVRKLSIWDVVTGNEVSVSENNTGGFWEVAWSPDGKIVASSSSDLLCGWEASTGDKLFCLDVHGGFPSDFDWSPDGSRIASTGYDSPIQVWEVSSGSLLVEIEGPGHGSQDIAWSQNGDFLIADGFIYDADSGKMLLGLEGLWLNDDQIVWFPEESWFITGNGTLRIWGIP